MKLPPVVRHFKQKNDPDSQICKGGDSKIWNSVTYYFCDFPTQKDKLKWHTHTAKNCRTCKCWLYSGSDTGIYPSDSKSLAQANVAKKSTTLNETS